MAGMPEVTRFRIARLPDRRLLGTPSQVPAHGARDDPTELVAAIIAALPDQGTLEPPDSETQQAADANALDAIATLVRAYLDDDTFLDPDLDPVSDADREVRRLDQWLVAGPLDPDPDDVRAQLFQAAVRIGIDPVTPETAAGEIAASEQWAGYRAQIGDSLVAALLAPADRVMQAAKAERLTRLILVAGLVEAFADPASGQLEGPDVTRPLLERVPVLPSPPFPLVKYLPTRSVLVRPPCFSDLYVVRDEWSCYVPGEIAHIENVLRGERKERVHKRTDETETTVTRVDELTTIDERDLQTTERTSLMLESREETELTVGVEGQVDTSGQYGPTHVDTHIGVDVEYSRETARRRAEEQAKETIARAVNRVERRVQETRTQRTLTRVQETNRHLLDNSVDPDGHVVGLYRWVDKIQRFQLFRYPNRYLLEFEVPEPAAFVRWLRSRPAVTPGLLEQPDPFTVDGKEEGERLAVGDITADSYAAIAARYEVTDLPEPPAPEVSVSEAMLVDGGTREKSINQWSELPFPPLGANRQEMTIPNGYEAVSAVASVGAVPELAKWLDGTDWDDTDGDGVEALTGWHAIVAAIEVGGKTALVSSQTGGDPANTVEQDPGLYGSFWLNKAFEFGGQARIPLDPRPTGKLSIAVVVGGSHKAALSVALRCTVMDATVAAWQAEVYALIHAAYANQLERWRAQEGAAADPLGFEPDDGSPARHAEITREELKRQVVEMLLGGQFDGFADVTWSQDTPPGRPRTNLVAARMHAPVIQFLEQALEWSNMTYILYPYFWAPSSQWPELEPIESADADFDRFLRCGSARVVVPARPGFATAVNHFLLFGRPWGGRSAPAPGDDLYVSVAQEIMDLTGAPDDGEPGDAWEARLPTTLVWLDPNAALPKQNDHRRLSRPADPICADDEEPNGNGGNGDGNGYGPCPEPA